MTAAIDNMIILERRRTRTALQRMQEAELLYSLNAEVIEVDNSDDDINEEEDAEEERVADASYCRCRRYCRARYRRAQKTAEDTEDAEGYRS